VIAAFLDGRLAGPERERFVAHAADCRHCSELLAESARALSASQTGSAAAPLAFPSRPARTRAWTWAAAAALAAAAGLGIAVRHPAVSTSAGHAVVASYRDPARVVAALRSAPIDRGGALAFDDTDSGTAFWFGVVSVDAEAALQAGDLAAAEAAARRSPPLGRWLRTARVSPTLIRRALGAVEVEMDEVPGAAAAAAWGRWAEAGRLAAAAGDAEFLRGLRSSRPPGSLEDAAADRVLAEIDAGLARITDDSGVASLRDLERAFERLILIHG
jgi:hypothetical protein